MAAPNGSPEIPLPPVPDVNPKMPWIQLGDFGTATSMTPPSNTCPTDYTPGQRAAARFGVHGNAICKEFILFLLSNGSLF